MTNERFALFIVDIVEGRYTPNPRMAVEPDGVTRYQRGDQACEWPREEWQKQQN